MSRHALRRTSTVIAGALALVVAIVAVALAKGTTSPTVDSATNAKLGAEVVVNAQGRTLYALSPETSAHLLCRSAACLANWPPLTVRSRKVSLKDGAGVQGRLGLVPRGKASFQVTLRGMPLYRFAGDHGRDEANGEGIKGFGGTWHAVTAHSGATPMPTQPSSPEASMPAPSTSTPETTPSAPTYPSYPTTSPAPMPTTSTPTPTTTTPTYPPYSY